MEFRAPLINGRTDTVQDSVEFNSRNQINSVNLNSPNAKGKRGAKRESIYKSALMQQIKNANLSQFSANKSSKDSDSDEEETISPNKVKKSRFGQI